MSDFVALPRVAPATAPAATTLPGGFWPDVALGDLRATANVPASVDDHYLAEAIRAAAAQLADELAAWRAAQTADRLEAITQPVVMGRGRLVLLWFRALRHLVRAELAEEYRGIDRTLEGDRRADALALTADAHRRLARFAIADFLGTSRFDCESI